jgi:hypothetical protein
MRGNENSEVLVEQTKIEEEIVIWGVEPPMTWQTTRKEEIGQLLVL